MFLLNKISKIRINNINILNLFYLNNRKCKIKFFFILKKFLNVKKNLLFLGRARTGIYLLVKYYLENYPGHNKNVLLAAYTIPDIFNLIVRAGGNPIFVDFDRRSTFHSLTDLKKKINIYTPKILVLTHYHLEEKELKKILNICKQKKIIVIEDKAVSYGAIQKRSFFGDAAIFSFSSFKLLNFYYGGALTCKNDSIFKKIQSEVNSWKSLNVFQYFRQVVLTTSYQFLTYKFIFNYFGFYFLNLNLIRNKESFYRKYFSKGKFDKSYFTQPSAGFFREIFSKINEAKIIQKHRVDIFLIYYKYLKNFSIPKVINKKQILSSSCYNFIISHKKSKLIRKILFKHGFDTGKSLYDNLNDLSNYKLKNINTKNLDRLYKNLIILPTHQSVKKEYAINLARKIIEITNNI
jgi:perosamine synthetase